MKTIAIAALLTFVSSSVIASDATIHGHWSAMDSVDEFTQNKSCAVLSVATDAGKYDTKILTVQYDGKMVNDNGEMQDILGLYMESKYSVVIIKSPKDAQVLIDGSRYDFGSDKFLDAAMNGTEMTVRTNDNARVYTRKFSLSGFTAAWNDATTRCAK